MPAHQMSNLEAFYRAQAKAANDAFNEGRYADCDKLCTELLADPHLPLMWRAHCHLLLATKQDETALANAEAAIRWYDRLLEKMPESEHLKGQRKEAGKQLDIAKQRNAKVHADEVELTEGEGKGKDGEGEGGEKKSSKPDQSE